MSRIFYFSCSVFFFFLSTFCLIFSFLLCICSHWWSHKFSFYILLSDKRHWNRTIVCKCRWWCCCCAELLLLYLPLTLTSFDAYFFFFIHFHLPFFFSFTVHITYSLIGIRSRMMSRTGWRQYKSLGC